ncbi:MAG TPA: hypothetical protein VH592_05375, partial [Gemmataceae bacterium]
MYFTIYRQNHVGLFSGIGNSGKKTFRPADYSLHLLSARGTMPWAGPTREAVRYSSLAPNLARPLLFDADHLGDVIIYPPVKHGPSKGCWAVVSPTENGIRRILVRGVAMAPGGPIYSLGERDGFDSPSPTGFNSSSVKANRDES